MTVAVDSLWIVVVAGWASLIVMLVSIVLPFFIFPALEREPVLTMVISGALGLILSVILFCVVWLKRVPLIPLENESSWRTIDDFVAAIPRGVWLLLGALVLGGVIGDALYYVSTGPRITSLVRPPIWILLVRSSIYIFAFASVRDWYLRFAIAGLALSGVLPSLTPLGGPSFTAWLCRKLLTASAGCVLVIRGWAAPSLALRIAAVAVLSLVCAMRLYGYYLWSSR